MFGAAVLYVLLISLAGIGSSWSFRLQRRHCLPFLRVFHAFVLTSFAYAVVGYFGEIFLPAVLPADVESLAKGYLAVDLITIPLLGGTFALFYLWISKLLGKTVTPAAKAAFWAVEALFLTVFAVPFVSYFARGYTAVSAVGAVAVNGIVLVLLGGAVLTLLLAAPAGKDEERRFLARRLGGLYAAAFAVLCVLLALPRALGLENPRPVRLAVAACLFLINFPALVHLRRTLSTRPVGPRLEGADPSQVNRAVRDAGITGRELEIARLVAAGLDNREIGKKLFISPKTVKNHLTNIYAKTGTRNRVQLANFLGCPGGEPGD